MAAAFAQGGGGRGGTITGVIRDRHQAKAAYRLLDRDEVTHEAVVAGHCAEVRRAMSAAGDYLLIEDTTAVSYPGLKRAEGLGPIGDAYTRGLWAHQTLVVKADGSGGVRQLLGLLGQRVWARSEERDPRRRRGTGRGKESNHARQSRADRESRRWAAHLEAAGEPSDGTTWTYVADRESDIYELFQAAQAHGWSYVIRASHPRALAGAEQGLDLLAAAKTAAVRGRAEVALSRPGERMELEVSSATLRLRGPKRPGGRLEDHTLHVVYARQLDAPAHEEPACWTLLTDLPVETLDQCQRVLSIYRARWLVEELHKAMKTGLGVEASQLSDARRLGALIGILSVVVPARRDSCCNTSWRRAPTRTRRSTNSGSTRRCWPCCARWTRRPARRRGAGSGSPSPSSAATTTARAPTPAGSPSGAAGRPSWP